MSEQTIKELNMALYHTLQGGQRIDPFIQHAEQAGLPQLARLLRAFAASEAIRAEHLHASLPEKAARECAYYVCPHCGLIYAEEAPERCPADDTPAGQFASF